MSSSGRSLIVRGMFQHDLRLYVSHRNVGSHDKTRGLTSLVSEYSASNNGLDRQRL